MASTLPVSFSRSSDKTDATQNSGDQMIEHQRGADPAETLENGNVLNEGGDAGTKGTGSAG